MSAAVYYSTHNLPVEDHKHTLPSLAQIMPPMGHDSLVLGQLSPQIAAQVNPYGQQMDQKFVYQLQPSPDVFSNGGSQPSSVNTTPASSFSAGSSNTNYIATSQGSEKCTCKSNANRIPRPRNAFILFRQKYHQLVLDEGSVIRTNPEVSRELGRRWRSLLPDEKDHWNNLAEEEKKNHANKYPGYKYTPRRNGKNKGCPACRQKALRQQQVQLHNQQMMQLQQDQYQQYLQMQQQQQAQQQAAAAAAAAAVGAPSIQQNSYPQNMSQFVIQSNPFTQQNFQFAYNTGEHHSLHHQDKLSPLSAPTSQYPQNSEFAPMGSNPQYVGYEQQHQQQHQPQHQPLVAHQQRFNSLPTPVNNGVQNYGFDVFNMPQQIQQ